MSYIEYVNTKSHLENPREELAHANRFTTADLKANRNGRISGGQWSRLLVSIAQPIQNSGAVLLGWLLFLYAGKTLMPGFMLWMLSLFGGRTMNLVFDAITLLCVFVFLLAVLRNARSMTLILMDLADGRAVCLEGLVTASRKKEQRLRAGGPGGADTTNCWYVCQEQYFAVSERGYSALAMGGQFRLYCTPRSRLLLSIEPKLSS